MEQGGVSGMKKLAVLKQKRKEKKNETRGRLR